MIIDYSKLDNGARIPTWMLELPGHCNNHKNATCGMYDCLLGVGVTFPMPESIGMYTITYRYVYIHTYRYIHIAVW